MTTFAFKDGYVAVDTSAVSGNWKEPFPCKKYRVLPNGAVIVFCGVLAEGWGFADWLEDCAELANEHIASGKALTEPLALPEQPKLEETTVVVFGPDGSVTVFEAGSSFQHEGAYGAWGSGSSVAYAALMMGKSAEEAVSLAAELDIFTSKPVNVIKIGEVPAAAE
jgi:ATP-dependent protease HslVU (ClpYQ) peptidase subunit